MQIINILKLTIKYVFFKPGLILKSKYLGCFILLYKNVFFADLLIRKIKVD